MAATAAGAAHLEAACKDGLSLLDELGTTSDPVKLRHRPVNRKLVQGCDGLVFVWSVRVGVVVGVQRSSGFMIRRLKGGRWSAPMFVSLSYGQIGAMAGYEKTGTVLASMTSKLAAQLELGVMPTFGVDVSVMSQQPYDTDPAHHDSRAGWGPSEKKSFGGGSDLVDITITEQGMQMSLGHFQGGVTKVDTERNAQCYGPGASVGDIVGGKVEPPAQMAALYERLARIACDWKKGGEEGDEKL